MRRAVIAVVAAALAASCTAESDTDVAATTTAPTQAVTTTTLAASETEPDRGLKPCGGEARITYWSGDSLNPLLSTWPHGFDKAYTVGALRSDWDHGGVVPYLLEVMPSLANGGRTCSVGSG